MKTLVNLYQCFWCDRTTKDMRKVKVDLRTGRLICHECSAANANKAVTT